ncbi:MAG TPA: AsmA-like C-terminal region-containing protein [Pirellulales bacterium]|nr:AsmA-like C-terminal region-containing protein [Pirellulales bacterium]
MIRCCWSSCKWGSLIALTGAAAAVLFFYHRIDDEVRRRVEAKIAAQYPELTVSVRSARLISGQGIEIRGLSIAEPGVSGPTAELAYIEEIFLHSAIDWRELMQGELSISTIDIRRPTIRVTHRADGSWSAARLFPLPTLGKTPPRGVIENGTVEISDPLKNQSGTYTLRDAQLEFEPDDRAPPSADGRIAMQLHGRLSGDHLRRAEVAASFAPSGERWSLAGTIEELEFSPELTRSLPGIASRRLAELGSLRAQMKGRFSVYRDPAARPALGFEIAGQVNRGRIDDPRLPYPLTDLRAVFQCNQQGLSVSEATASSGQTTLHVTEFKREGYSPNSPCSLKAEGRRLLFASQLKSALPQSWQDEWQKFMPSGEFDVDKLELVYDGARWTPHLVLRSLNVAFSYYKFPYRLERAAGHVELKDRRLSVHLKAYSEGELVRLDGEFLDPGARATGFFEASADNVRFDEKLFLALAEPARRIVRSLNPRGAMNVVFRCEAAAEARPVWRPHLRLALNRCSLRYDDFPYPLDNIRGQVMMHDGLWEFVDGVGLEGSNDTGWVTCQGRLIPSPAGYEVSLNFKARNVPLEEELRDALAVRNPGAARLWHDMKPRGAVDLEAIIGFSPQRGKPLVTVTASPSKQGEQPLSIEPSYFPYRLEILRGTFAYRDGRVKFDDLRMQHRNTILIGRGACDVDSLGGWRLALDKIEVDRLRADRDLVQALGAGRLKKLLADLQPAGPVNLRGRLTLAKSGEPRAPITSSWDLSAIISNGRLECGVALERISGGAAFKGDFDGEKFRCQGELAIDSANYKDFQFTQILGPFWIDDSIVLCGRMADKRAGAPRERPLTGLLYGGRLRSDVKVGLGADSRYFIHAELTGADLARWAQEAVPGQQQLSGRVSADINFQGNGRGLHNLGGRGSVWVNDAVLYELPVMVSLLKTLRGRAPDTTAFNTADLNFRIEGEHVYLNQIHCQGDAISLRGAGELNLDRSVKLTFYPIVGRDEARFPAVDKLLGRASQQFMLIHVDGTLDAPQTRSEPFPALAQALQAFPQLQAAPSPPEYPRQAAGGGRASLAAPPPPRNAQPFRDSPPRNAPSPR